MKYTLPKGRALVAFIAAAAPWAHASAQSAPNIAQMFSNFSSASVSLMNLAVGIAFVMGLFVTGIGIITLRRYVDEQGRMSLAKPFAIIFVGAALVALPGFIDTATNTLGLGSNTGTQLLSQPNLGSSVPGMDQAIAGVLLFVKLLGHVAFIRGFFLLKRLGEGDQQASLSRAMTHILGGAMAININATIGMLGATFAPGMSLGGLGA